MWSCELEGMHGPAVGHMRVWGAVCRVGEARDASYTATGIEALLVHMKTNFEVRTVS